jgi:hypothetical protein
VLQCNIHTIQLLEKDSNFGCVIRKLQ